jgi:hypothetical protein
MMVDLRKRWVRGALFLYGAILVGPAIERALGRTPDTTGAVLVTLSVVLWASVALVLSQPGEEMP